jgi:site-specific recombinase XerD
MVSSGLPLHVAATLLGHLNLDTTRGYTNPRELQQMGDIKRNAC